MKTYEECKREIARKYGFKNLVMGHLVKYFDEAAELYASQFNNKQKALPTDMESKQIAFLLYPQDDRYVKTEEEKKVNEIKREAFIDTIKWILNRNSTQQK